MVKRTKTCQITVHLKSGECLRGRYHVDGSTSSSVRPSDALRESTSPYLLLTSVRADEGETPEGEVVLIRADAVSYVELPAESWS